MRENGERERKRIETESNRERECMLENETN